MEEPIYEGYLSEEDRIKFVEKNKRTSRLNSRQPEFIKLYKEKMDEMAGIGLVDKEGDFTWCFGPGRHEDLVPGYKDNDNDYIRFQMVRMSTETKQDRIVISTHELDERVPNLIKFLFINGVVYTATLNIRDHTDIDDPGGDTIFEGTLGGYLKSQPK